MGSNNRAIDKMEGPVKLSGGISLLLDRGKEPVPDASVAPAIEAARHRAPTPIAPGQIAPWGTGAQNPQDAIDDALMGQSRSTGFRFLRRKQWFEPLPLRVG